MLKRFIEECNKYAHAYGVPLGLIIIDTWNRALGGAEENGSADMGRAISMLDSARAESSAAINVVHHFGKDTSRGARGHSSINGAVDTEIQIFRNRKTKIHTIKLGKMKDAEDETECYFKLQSVHLGYDKYNEPVTSAVPIFIDSAEGVVDNSVGYASVNPIGVTLGNNSRPYGGAGPARKTDSEYSILYIEFARKLIAESRADRATLRREFSDYLVQHHNIILDTAQHAARRIEKKCWNEISRFYEA